MVTTWKEPTSSHLVSSKRNTTQFKVYRKLTETRKILALTVFESKHYQDRTSREPQQFDDIRVRNVLGFVITSLILLLLLGHAFTYRAIHDKTLTQYTVEPGDSLWTIAEHEDPVDGTQDVINWVLQHNHLDPSETIYPGEVITTPVAARP
jgi:hypothetical protein